MKALLVLFGLITASACLAQHAHHGTAGSPAVPVGQPAQDAWTSQPLLLPGRNPRGERSGAWLKLQNIAATHLTVFAPEGPADRLKVAYPIEAGSAKIASATPKIGNYHWVVAREESATEVRVASTAWYFGNPGDSPKALHRQSKHELEIVPDPLPREHASYRESEKWRFLVRFNGQPLANQPVTLETEFGSRVTFVTDAAGIATVLFPRDFKPVARAGEDAGHGPRRAAFVLSTVKEDESRRYLTAFNATYAPDADRGKSLGWGAAFGVIGMLAATPLLRRKKGSTGNA